MAYFDYQGSRILPVSMKQPDHFGYELEYAKSASLVMDLRSNRLAGKNGRLLSNSQKRGFLKFLTEQTDKKILFFVLSVPVVHIPRILARLASQLIPFNEDFSDRWSAGAHSRDRDWLLKKVCEHKKKYPGQRIIFLSGDIHIGCAHKISWSKTIEPIYQFVSSPITHTTEPLIREASKWIIRANRRIAAEDKNFTAKVRLLKGVKGKNRNPYGGLNLGIAEINSPGPDATPQLRFFLYGHRKELPVCVFQSTAI